MRARGVLKCKQDTNLQRSEVSSVTAGIGDLYFMQPIATTPAICARGYGGRSGRRRGGMVLALALMVLLNASAAIAADDGAKAPPLLSAPRAAAPKPPRPADAKAASYESCMTLARNDPTAGRKQAEEWQK